LDNNILMSDTQSTALPLPLHENSSSPGGRQEVKWQVVAQMPGLTPATIVAGRLKAEEVPVRFWQEGAGQALGLTVGLLGTGYVAVPEEFVDQALEILAYEEDPELLAEQFDDFEESAFEDGI
jgi:hypothetical protein